MQQGYAKTSNIKESFPARDAIDMALHMHIPVLEKLNISILVDCPPSLILFAEKHKVIQILVNLISNSKHACEAADVKNPEISIKASESNNSTHIVVTDNGVGIPEENLTRIFSHGFTTKKDGHGFGLHGSAIAAKEMNGSLSVTSNGSTRGAVFTLTLPVETPIESQPS